MITDLPVGTIIEFAQNGHMNIWQVVFIPADGRYRLEDTMGYGNVTRPIVDGDIIHRVVWKKGGRIEVRNSRTVKAGEFDWRYVGKGILPPHDDVWANWNNKTQDWA